MTDHQPAENANDKTNSLSPLPFPLKGLNHAGDRLWDGQRKPRARWQQVSTSLRVKVSISLSVLCVGPLESGYIYMSIPDMNSTVDYVRGKSFVLAPL